LVEQRGVDLQPERFGVASLDRQRQLEATPPHVEVELRLGREQLILDDITGHLATDGKDLVTGQQAGPGSR
jgi:hypothetical protein